MKEDKDESSTPSPGEGGLERLRDDLRFLYRRTPPVPPEIDRAILAQGPPQGTQSLGRRIIRLRTAAAVAAALLLAATGVWLVPQLRTPRAPEDSGKVAGRTAESSLDFDGSKRVDILDAFWLARKIEEKGPMDPRWDLNGDGVVNQADVDIVAQAAVRVT